MIIHIVREWLRWRKNWDDLCRCCGKCCYERRAERDGSVTIFYQAPCEYLDTETRRCRIYPERLTKCDRCGKVNLRTALFNPTLPEDCAYRQTFRVWDRK